MKTRIPLEKIKLKAKNNSQITMKHSIFFQKIFMNLKPT